MSWKVLSAVHGNVNVTGMYSHEFGLQASDTSSRIHLLFPLTKESVSTNNGGGRNYGSYRGEGTIETVTALASFSNKKDERDDSRIIKVKVKESSL